MASLSNNNDNGNGNGNSSPLSRKLTSQFEIHEEPASWAMGPQEACNPGEFPGSGNRPVPLTTSKLANYTADPLGKVEAGLKAISKDHDSAFAPQVDERTPIDKLLATLSERTNGRISSSPASQRLQGNGPARANSSLITEQNESSRSASAHVRATPEQAELEKVREELQAARNKIAVMDQELSQQKITNPSVEPTLQSSSDKEHQLNSAPADVGGEHLAASYGSRAQQHIADPGSDRSEAASTHSSDGLKPYWNTGELGSASNNVQQSENNRVLNEGGWHTTAPPPWSNWGFRGGNASSTQVPQAEHAYMPTQFRNAGQAVSQQFPANMQHPPFEQSSRRVGAISRPGSAAGMMYNAMPSYPASMTSSSTGFSPPTTPLNVPPMHPMNTIMNQGPQPFQPRPIGASLSPTALEFNAAMMMNNNAFPPSNWNAQPTGPENIPTYIPPVEPINYRRLLDRNASCNWRYIVDKIVCNNDQQASIFLQQKLKNCTPKHKFELVEAIITQAYPLMINRFGNFLVQRCLEHGTPEQVVAIANAIRGNTLNLSMDAFGCHVVQKAFDVVPEDYKALMVHELLRRIPETVIHRYACHVWQKLFELRWSDSPPQIMKYVNESLRGMWHEVALGETGSLVVQNIFENCLEEDKRPCINEVLASIDIIAHGQFGNWCIQHICEHGLPADKSRAIEQVLRYASEYSTDQFASKVVEKCLKVGGTDFVDRYLAKVCEGRQDRPRMPLIDIAGDQYGNYLIQYILIHAGPQHRETVSNHIRKHMVSLRGSKFGSRVAMLCSNPAYATRPGPPVGMQMASRYMSNMAMPRPAIGTPYR